MVISRLKLHFTSPVFYLLCYTPIHATVSSGLILIGLFVFLTLIVLVCVSL